MSIGKRVKISEEQNIRLETITIICLAIFAIASYLLTNFVFKKDTRNITVFVNGTRVTQVGGHRIDLNVSGTYTIGDPNGDFNIIEIRDHQVRCIDANCPDKVCVSHGYINPDIDNDIIICAPHKLTIQYQ